MPIILSCLRGMVTNYIYKIPYCRALVCKIPLLARTLGLKAKRARDNRVYCIQVAHALGLAFRGLVRARARYLAYKVTNFAGLSIQGGRYDQYLPSESSLSIVCPKWLRSGGQMAKSVAKY